MSLTDRDWTLFILEAEEEHFGLSRLVSVHNAARKRIAELAAEVERLRALCKEALSVWGACTGGTAQRRFKIEGKLRKAAEAAKEV